MPKKDRNQIKLMIEEKLGNQPDVFGKPLRRSLKGCRSLRTGDYRVIFRIIEDNVDILLIEHRSVVYGKLERKIKEGVIDVSLS